MKMNKHNKISFFLKLFQFWLVYEFTKFFYTSEVHRFGDSPNQIRLAIFLLF